MTNREWSALTAELQRAAETFPSHAQQHVRSIGAQIDAIARGDFDAVLVHAHDDVTLEIFAPPEFQWVRQARGPSELRAALVQNFGSVEHQQPQIRDVFAEGDMVILFGREEGRIKHTGRPYDVEFVQRFTFRGGRLAAVRMVAAYATEK